MMGSVWRIDKSTDLDLPSNGYFLYAPVAHSVRVGSHGLCSTQAHSGGTRRGQPLCGHLALGVKRIPMTYTIRELEPPHLAVLAGKGEGFRAVDRIRLEPRPLGTRLSYAVEITFDQRHSPLADGIGRGFFDRYADWTIRRLQAMLNGSPGSLPALTPVTRLADRAILPGLIGFTTLGYRLGKHRRPVASALYAGRTMVLTGGTSGIGRAAARELVRRGARVVVVGRNAEKLNALRMELAGMDADGSIATERSDLSLLSDVRDLAARLLWRHDAIDVLIKQCWCPVQPIPANP